MKINLGDISLTISPNVLKVFHQYEQFGIAHESGGILLGKKIQDVNSFYITEITEPNPQDSSGTSFFVRNKKYAQQIINERWKDSGGIINYLGEWHTHCCALPKPSFTDKRLIKQIKKDKVSPFNVFFMIIVGQNKNMYIEAVKNDKHTQHITKQINYKDVTL